ncbi:MAG: hypothetical protein HUN05_19090 [Desulfobacter sp.]|nr:MAG: hypothetical protein HUN05_19090 [Desulfobacter sp.]
MKQIFVIAAAVLLFLCSAGLAANYPEYGIQTPAGWAQRKNLSQDLLHQIVEPGNNAMIEVYYNKGSVGSLENMADQWEGAGRQRGTPYLTYKHTSKHLSYAYKNTPAIQRTYSGVHNGSTLGCIVNFMQYDGFIVIVVGIYPKDYKTYGGPLLSAFSTFTPGRAPKKTAGPVSKQPRPETKGTVSPEQMVKTYYGILESEDLNALETILIASPGGRLSQELGAYRLVFSSVDQKIRDLDIMEKNTVPTAPGVLSR